MSEITGYFAAKKYIGRRVLFLISGGVLVLITASVAFGKGLLSPRELGLVMICYAACVAVTVFVILKNARATFQASSGVSRDAADDATRNRFRKHIRRLRLGVAFFAIVLIYGLWETRGEPWTPRLVGATMNLLIQTVMIQSIRRMQRQLNQETSNQGQ